MTDLNGARAEAAILGAAVGDALGWPQENRSSNIERKMPEPVMAFRSWRRRSGGRFMPYDETIPAGSYSDDTQMICAVARSIARGTDWFDWFTQVELPTFPVYQRGAGRSLLASCQSWLAGTPPWRASKAASRRSYFDAGGNGGAMRILPHAIVSADRGGDLLYDQIVCDVLTTHGHPRAVLGAALHAEALRIGLSLDRTLEYGELIEVLMKSASKWGSLPNPEELPGGWSESWSETIRDPFAESWRKTVDEIQDLLAIALKGMRSGALASELETLRELGCTGVKTVGSGTASAVGAVYLASRSAANPRAGLLAAAYLAKADTDTLASMTASLLGALAGSEWLASLETQVHDWKYLAGLVEQLRRSSKASRPAESVTKSATDRFVKTLDNALPGSGLSFPDGREVTLDTRDTLESRSESSSVEAFNLRAEDGQSLRVIRAHRRSNSSRQSERQGSLPLTTATSGAGSSSIVRVGMKIEVSDLKRMRTFYEQVVGMTATRVGQDFVTLNDSLALSASGSHGGAGHSRIALYLDVNEMAGVWDRVATSGFEIVDSLAGSPGRRRFRCLDPEGNLIEIRETP